MAVIANEAVKDLLRFFPTGLSYAFAYGSGVFVQKGQLPGKMTDLVLVVDDPVEWHEKNLDMNPHHYSFMKYFGPSTIAEVQERMACGVYYNPFCEMNGMLVKYGVISTSALQTDLKLWSQLYIAGRLHKPVVDLMPAATEELESDLRQNRLTALRAGLLQGGRSFSKFDLFHNIAKLSYIGDTRMMFAENPNKTRNIVMPLMSEFERIYLPLFYETPYAAIMSDGMIIQDISAVARYKHLIALPIPIQICMVRAHFKDPRIVDVEEVLADISHDPYPGVFLCDAIKEVVRGSSIRQTIQGLGSAGFWKSVHYGFEKIKKRFQKTRVIPKEAVTSCEHVSTTYGHRKSIPNVEEVLSRKRPP